MNASGAPLDGLSAAPLAKTTKKKSRRTHDADVTSGGADPLLDTGELSMQASARTERDDPSSSGTSSTRPTRQHRHRHHARATDVAANRAEQTSAESQRLQSQPRAFATSSSNGSNATPHRRFASTPKRDPASVTPDIAAVSIARQSLTSSASALRPSKQRLERNRLLSQAHIECRAQLDRYSSDAASSNNNNNNDSHEPGNDDDDDQSGYDRPEVATSESSGIDDWTYEQTAAAPTPALPARARLYRNALPRRESIYASEDDAAIDDPSARVRREVKASRTAKALNVPLPPHIDRPPSRQRHAFPTHLVDTNGFLASPSPSGTSTSRPNNNRASREKEVHSATASVPTDGTLTERPPSRYMTKAKRSAAALARNSSPTTQSASPDDPASTRLPSRRCLDSVYSLNQVNHDPKTDGFADVDESVPPPFRIEITTDSHHAVSSGRRGAGLPYRHRQQPSPRVSSTDVPRCTTRAYALPADRSSLQSRRWSSFGNQEQLAQHMTGTADCDDRSPRIASGESARQDTVSRKKCVLVWLLGSLRH